MPLETVTWAYTANLHTPLKTTANATTVEWEAPDLPTLPLRVNKKGLNEHTRLVLFQQIPKRQSGERRTSKDGGSKESIEAESM